MKNFFRIKRSILQEIIFIKIVIILSIGFVEINFTTNEISCILYFHFPETIIFNSFRRVCHIYLILISFHTIYFLFLMFPIVKCILSFINDLYKNFNVCLQKFKAKWRIFWTVAVIFNLSLWSVYMVLTNSHVL